MVLVKKNANSRKLQKDLQSYLYSLWDVRNLDNIV